MHHAFVYACCRLAPSKHDGDGTLLCYNFAINQHLRPYWARSGSAVQCLCDELISFYLAKYGLLAPAAGLADLAEGSPSTWDTAVGKLVRGGGRDIEFCGSSDSGGEQWRAGGACAGTKDCWLGKPMMSFDEWSHESCIGVVCGGRRALWGVNAAGTAHTQDPSPSVRYEGPVMAPRGWRR
jgi:hypothetical protein